MPALDALRRRIDSIARLLSVVRTMKVLAAASIRQYEQAVAALADYERTIELGLQVVMRSARGPRLRRAARPAERPALVVIGSDQGMCGGFNEDVTRCAAPLATPRSPGARAARVLAIGERCAGRLGAAGAPAAERMHLPASIAGIGGLVQDVAALIERWLAREGVDRVVLIHNRSEQWRTRPVVRQLLPLDPGWLRSLRRRAWPTRVAPMFVQDGEELFHALVRQHLWVALYRAVAESQEAENFARLRAMQAAEHNVEEHLAGVRRSYDRRRQDAITEELMDVVVGCEALERRD